jgi:hypothetical protein
MTPKYSYHSLLPIQLQSNLMSAAETKKLDMIDAAIAATMVSAPSKYHTAKTLDERVFFNEPRQITTPMAGFIHPVPKGMIRI